MKKNSDLKAFDNLHEHSWGFAKTRVIMTSFELQLYDALEKNVNNSKQIAEYLECNEDGIQFLLNALENMNILYKKNNYYYINKEYKQFVLTNSEYYIGHMWKMYERLNWETWKYLTFSIKNGTPINKIFQYDKNELWNDIIPYLDSIAKICANEIAKVLVYENKNDGVILDLGCGSGVYSKVILNNIENMESVCIDQKNVIENVEFDEKISKKIKLIEGNFLNIDYGEEKYDAILLSNIIHGYNMDTIRNVIKKCYKALKPGGILLINDLFSKEGNGLFGSLFNIHSYLIGDGQMYSIQRVVNELELIGIKNNKIKELSGPFTLLYSIK